MPGVWLLNRPQSGIAIVTDGRDGCDARLCGVVSRLVVHESNHRLWQRADFGSTIGIFIERTFALPLNEYLTP
ncbi:hypothetical protein ACFXTO_002517 [Malus domestica]